MTRNNPRAAAEIGTLIKRSRERQGLTIEELGKRSGITPHHLATLEQGVREPSFSTMCAIAEGLGVSLGEMVSEECVGPSESALELVKLYAEAPKPVREALPLFLNACIAAKEAKARRRERKQMGAR